MLFKINAIIIAYKTFNELKQTRNKNLNFSQVVQHDDYGCLCSSEASIYSILFTLLFPLRASSSGRQKYTRLKKIYHTVPYIYIYSRSILDCLLHPGPAWELGSKHIVLLNELLLHITATTLQLSATGRFRYIYIASWGFNSSAL